MIWSDSARDLRMENMISCLRKDDTFFDLQGFREIQQLGGGFGF